MADEIERVIGADEAAGYRRYVDFVSKLYRYEMRDFIDRNIDSPLDLLTAQPRPARRDRRLPQARPEGRAVPATTRAPQRIYSLPGDVRRAVAVRRARASTRSSPTWTPSPACSSPTGGMHAVPQAMAAAAEKHGVDVPLLHRGHPGRALRGPAPSPSTPPTASGSPCDVVVLNPDLPVAYRDLLGQRRRGGSSGSTYSPSCFLLLAGSTARYPRHRAPQHPLRARRGAGSSTS